MTETERGFSCSRYREGCRFTLWKDGLTRGGGPALTERLLRLVLEKKTVRGSTGTVTLDDRAIRFYPNGSDQPSASRPLVWEKRQGG